MKSPKTGQTIEYCYEHIGSKPVRDYFRDKMADQRRRNGTKSVSNSAPLTDSDRRRIIELYKSGMSQFAIAAKLNTTRYRIQRALGVR